MDEGESDGGTERKSQGGMDGGYEWREGGMDGGMDDGGMRKGWR